MRAASRCAASCSCQPSAGTGAATGSLKISGKVTSGGQPVAGSRVFLNGNAQACAGDRITLWAGFIAFEFQQSTSDVFAVNDCRFGKWQVPPILQDLSPVGVIQQQGNSLPLFTLQLFGCALTNNLVGPLNLQGSLIPPDLVRAGLTFTTADLSALEDEYVSAITLGLSDLGAPPLSAAQTTAVRAQLDFAARETPGVVSSSKLTYSTCP